MPVYLTPPVIPTYTTLPSASSAGAGAFVRHSNSPIYLSNGFSWDEIAKATNTFAGVNQTYYSEDFCDFLNGTNGTWFTATNVGTGAATALQSVGTMNATEKNAFGVISCSTGTTATGSSAILTGNSSFLLGAGSISVSMGIMIPTLSVTGTNQFIARFGFLDTTSADATDGVYFEYDLASSANWRICTANNSTRTKNNGVDTVTTNPTKLEMYINDAGTQADFYVNGNQQTPSITTNLPNTSGREFGLGMHIIKSVGTTARLIYADYFYYRASFTLGR